MDNYYYQVLKFSPSKGVSLEWIVEGAGSWSINSCFRNGLAWWLFVVWVGTPAGLLTLGTFDRSL